MSRLRENITFLVFVVPVFVLSAVLGMRIVTLEPAFFYFHQARGSVEPNFMGFLMALGVFVLPSMYFASLVRTWLWSEVRIYEQGL
jgi:hypothetical protein